MGYLTGLIILKQGHPQEAIAELRKSSLTTHPEGAWWGLLFQHLALAAALEQEGKIDEAILELQKGTGPGGVDFVTGWAWPQCRLKLAELYRKAGHPEEAMHVEDEMRHYLSVADPDHPVLMRLKATQRAKAK